LDIRLFAIGVALIIAGVSIAYYSSATVVSDARVLDARSALTYSRDLQNFPFSNKILKINVVIEGGNASFYLLDTVNLRLYQTFKPFQYAVGRENMIGSFSTDTTPTNNTVHFIVDNNKGSNKINVGITAMVDYGFGGGGAVIGIVGLGASYFGLSSRGKRKPKK
jgi:hypothetical protein